MYVHEYVYTGEGEVLYLLSKGETWDEIEECVTLVCVCVCLHIYVYACYQTYVRILYLYIYVYIDICIYIYIKYVCVHVWV